MKCEVYTFSVNFKIKILHSAWGQLAMALIGQKTAISAEKVGSRKAPLSTKSFA